MAIRGQDLPPHLIAAGTQVRKRVHQHVARRTRFLAQSNAATMLGPGQGRRRQLLLHPTIEVKRELSRSANGTPLGRIRRQHDRVGGNARRTSEQQKEKDTEAPDTEATRDPWFRAHAAVLYRLTIYFSSERSIFLARSETVDYWTLAELRYHLRRFFRVREEAARAAGVEPQQYLVLLQAKGLQGREPVTIGALAERLQLRHHSTVELVDRLVERGMVARRDDPHDRRGVIVELRPAGEAVLKRLAQYSLDELRTEGPALVAALGRLLIGRRARGARRRTPSVKRRSR